MLLCVHTLNNPSAHPSYSNYYLLSPSTPGFFLFVFCTSIVLHFYSIAHCILISLFFTIYMLLCCVTFLSFFILLHCPLSGPDLMYISLLIIPCIIYYVTNKETLNLELRKMLLALRGSCFSVGTSRSIWKQFSKEHKQTFQSRAMLLLPACSAAWMSLQSRGAADGAEERSIQTFIHTTLTNSITQTANWS